MPHTPCRRQQRWPAHRTIFIALSAAFAQPLLAADDKTLAAVEVVATVPLAGIGLPAEQVPAHVTVFGARQLEASATLGEALAAQVGSLQVNDTQGNPFQPDIQYRGFNASPLLGTPQGLSVFVDGVRMNAPFGDVVNWDLIPKQAIGKVTLIPGSNPVFGLNTLGGALALETKNGRSDPGTAVTATLGSFGRRELAFEHGGFKDALDWYVAAAQYRDHGWRAASPSDVRQLFGKLRQHDRAGDIALSLAATDSSMNGNGLAPESFLAADRSQPYTIYDNTGNRSWLLNLSHSRLLGDDAEVRSQLYARQIRTTTFNADINQIADARFGVQPFEDDPQPGVNEASVNRSHLQQDGLGFSVQAAFGLDPDGGQQLVAGLALDAANTAFQRSYQLGAFNPDRSARTTGVETEINHLGGKVRSWGLYASDTLALSQVLHLTLSGRYNLVQVATADRLVQPLLNAATPGVNDPNFNSDYTYRSFNPALGATWQVTPETSLYASLNRGSRAPSPVELACADPNNACLLPNQMASDPYLAQVRTTTVEAGARGNWGKHLRWNASLYRATNRDDILFISTASGGAGYFSNFGQTRRQGLELGLAGKHRRWDWSLDYALTDATFQSAAVIQSPNNSRRSDISSGGVNDDQIEVRPGNRLPGIPRHTLKLGLTYAAGEKWSLGGQLQAYSWQYARGNENNAHQAGTFTSNLGNTRTFAGSGRVPGYAVLNLQASYRPQPQQEWFARVNNVFDRAYGTAGLLGENAFPGGVFDATGDNGQKEMFVAPGAPRSFWLGVRIRID
jgi:iron complex outermembrane recepter protein